jgi:7-cyano-7-deazaguanine synthase in queuosine biosynthesis
MSPKDDEINPYLLVCNGAKGLEGSRDPKWQNIKPQLLRTHLRDANVILKITDITDQMAKRLTPVVEDLIEIAAMVYAADQACRRIFGKSFDWGTRFVRRFRFEIAVREPEFWNRADVKDRLCRTLHFLSYDDYEFAFSKYSDPPEFEEYLDFKKGTGIPPRPKRVMLFSGGLDSLAGAAEEIFKHDRRIALVSHKPVDHMAVKQSALVKEIQRRAKKVREGLAPLHFAIKANKAGELTADNTQRSRSFLYASMAAAVADLFGLDEIYFYENGIVSMNLPLCGQEVGGRATRTTHPQVLDGLRELFSLVLDRPFAIRNEYLWDTKQDVLVRLFKTGNADLASMSCSCIHTRRLTHKSPHCGLCSQCLSRWMASLGAEYDDFDPPAGYHVGVLTGERKKDEDRILAERFIGLARGMTAMSSPDEFYVKYALELGRAWPHTGIPEQDAMERLFDLHRRHAEQVNLAIERPMKEHIQELLNFTLPDTCALSYAFNPMKADEKKLRLHEQRVRLHGPHGKPVLFGSVQKPPLSKAAYSVVEALVRANGDGMRKRELEKICGDARGVLRRLAKDKDWRQVIHFPGTPGHGYRIE